MDNIKNYNFNLPGRIVSYDASTQTATIKICAERITNNTNELDVLEEYGNLVNVPVHTPSGGGWSMTFPIKENDTCMVVFSQVGYDHWMFLNRDKAGTLGGVPKPWLHRCLSLNDSYAIVGFNTIPNPIPNLSPTDSEWRNTDKTQKITLAESGDISIDSPTNIDITAPNVSITGDLQITGEVNITGGITSTGDIVAGTISLQSHTHTDGNNGSPTGPPIP